MATIKPKQEKLDLESKPKVDGVPVVEGLENIKLTELVAAILKGNQDLQERFISIEERKILNEEQDKKKVEEITKNIDKKAREIFEDALKKFESDTMVDFIGEEYMKEFSGTNIKFSINGVVFEIPLNGTTTKLPPAAAAKARKIINSRMSKVNIKETKEYDGQVFRPKE